MTFTFKLARRLARLRIIPALLLPILAACAAGEPLDPSTSSIDTGDDGAVALSPRTVTVEGTQGVLFRAFESLIPGSSQVTSIEWTTTGGSIAGDGNYTPGTTGAFRVVGRRKGNPHNPPDTSVVIVVPPQPSLVAVVLTPSTTTVGGGLQQQFSAAGRLSDGTEVPIGVTWSATGGSIDAGGLYTAGLTPGSYRVIATHVTTSLADTSVVTVPPATLSSITLSPGSTSLSPGQGQQFSVTGRLSDGTTSYSVPVAYTATGGSISVTGYYTAGSSGGTFRVIATSQSGKADTSSVSVSGSVLPGSTWLNEDFTSYGGATATWKSNPHAWMGGSGTSWFNQQQIFIDTQQLYNGHPTLRYDWPSCGNGTISLTNTTGDAGKDKWCGCSADPAIVADYKMPGASEVWVEAVHKFATNWDDRGYKQVQNPDGTWGGFVQPLTQCGFGEYKMLLMLRTSDRMGGIGNGHEGTSWWTLSGQSPPLQATLDAGTHCSSTGGGENCQWGYGDGQAQFLPNIPDHQWDGQWHTYRIHVRFPAVKGEATGVLEVWVDGKKVVGRYNRNFINESTGYFANRYIELLLGSNSNSGTRVPTQVWWGHLKVWTSNPGW
ncbi:MAG TPA: hypothetical protein VE091_07315 [Gemmatimonadales bacterium]|nr:hypothetical protein [Gemmatimonadales bacterium]